MSDQSIDRLADLLDMERRNVRAFSLSDQIVTKLAAASEEAKGADELMLRLILSNLLLSVLPLAADVRAILAGGEPAAHKSRNLFAVAKMGG